MERAEFKEETHSEPPPLLLLLLRVLQHLLLPQVEEVRGVGVELHGIHVVLSVAGFTELQLPHRLHITSLLTEIVHSYEGVKE